MGKEQVVEKEEVLEDQDAPENSPDKEDEKVEPEPSGEEDSDEQGEDSEVGEDSIEDERGEEDYDVEALKAKIAELEKRVSSPEKEPEYKEPTPEEQAAMAERYGMEYKSIQFVNGQMANLGNSIKEYVDNLFSQLSVGSAIKSLGNQKGFEDVGKYESDIQKFLNTEVAPGRRSDPKMLQMAYYYAKGLKSSGAVKTAMASKERNKKIGTSGRPSSPSSGKTTPKASVKLNPTQRSAARAFGMSEEEYTKYMKK